MAPLKSAHTQGSLKVGDSIELPALKLAKQVRSMQMFKKPVTRVGMGDRVGVCVTQLDPTLIERGLACTPGTVPTFTAAVAAVEKIRFFAGKVPSKAKFHVSLGHTTAMAEMTFFGQLDGEGTPMEAALAHMVENLNRMGAGGPDLAFDTSREYLYQEELYGLEGRPCISQQPGALSSGLEGLHDLSAAGEEGLGPHERRHYGRQWVLLRFDQPVTVPKDALVIGAKFDVDVHGDSCRLAFYGRLVQLVDPSKPQELSQIRAYKVKEKQGVIERILPEQDTAIVRGLFKKETTPDVYVGLKVVTGLGEVGVIESSFGKSGKLKVSFAGGLQATTGARSGAANTVYLQCKRYVFDHGPDRKRLRQ